MKFNFKLPHLSKGVGVWVYWIPLLILLGLDAWVLQTSAQLALDSRKEDQSIIDSKTVRVNFNEYQNVQDRIEEGLTVQPGEEQIVDPFNVDLEQFR